MGKFILKVCRDYDRNIVSITVTLAVMGMLSVIYSITVFTVRNKTNETPISFVEPETTFDQAVYIQKGTQSANLSCGEVTDDVQSILWEKYDNNVNDFDTIMSVNHTALPSYERSFPENKYSIDANVSLVVNNVELSDVGQYRCVYIEGSIPYMYSVMLLTPGPPGKPEKLKFSKESNSIVVSWEEGLSGGSEQFFTVCHHKAGNDPFICSDQIKGIKYEQNRSYKILGLNSDTKYEVQVLAENGFEGRSATPSDTHDVQTKPSKLWYLTSLFIPANCFTLACALWRKVKRDRKKKNQPKRMKKQDEQNDEGLLTETNVDSPYSEEIHVPLNSNSGQDQNDLGCDGAAVIEIIEGQSDNACNITITNESTITNTSQDRTPALSKDQNHGPVERFEIKYETLSLNREDLLGAGSFGRVYKARLHGSEVAAKEIVIQGKVKDRLSCSIINEITISAKIRHPSIVLFMHYAIDFSFNCVFLIYELINGDNLENIITDENNVKEYNFNLFKRYDVSYQMAGALEFLHAQNIVHGDVKPANVMVTKSGQAKLCDLGTSTLKHSKDALTTTYGGMGTPLYMAPEQLLDGHSSSKCGDVYAFGATTFEVLFDKHMWKIAAADSKNKEKNTSAILRKMVKDQRVSRRLLKKKGHPAYEVLIECTQFEYGMRPAVRDVKKKVKRLMESFK